MSIIDNRLMKGKNKMELERDILLNSYYIIDYFKKNGQEITNLKLQKLLYLEEAIYMSASDENYLFVEEFSAWDFGPVSKVIYQKYKKSSAFPLNLTEDEKEQIKEIPMINESLIEVLFSLFGNMTAFELVTLTHRENSPWYNINKNYSPNSIPNDININKEQTKLWFKELMEDKNEKQ